MNKKLFLLFIFFILTSVILSAFGNRDKSVPTVQVTGIVRLVGTSIFPEIVISAAEHDWYIPREEMDKLHDLQHHTVIVEGVEVLTELKFANGHSAGIRRELHNITVISIE